MKRRQAARVEPAKAEAIPDPLDSLVLWLMVLGEKEDSAALDCLGISAEELERLKRDNPRLLQRMRKLGLAGQRLLINELATLLRARIGEELMRARDAKSIAVLTTAMARMQGWMFWKKLDSSFEPPIQQQPVDAESPRVGSHPVGTFRSR